MEDKKLNEKESLELITEMIARTRQRYMGDGNIMLMWGYLTVAVAAIVWIMLVITRNQAWNWLWFLNGIIGGIATPLMSRKQREKSGVKNYSDKVTSNLWLVVGLTSIVATVVCFVFSLCFGYDSWRTMLEFALVIVPFAEMAQGIVVNEKSFIIGGAVGLLAGIITMCCIAGGVGLKVVWFMPMFIVAFIAMMIVPGHIINHKVSTRQ